MADPHAAYLDRIRHWSGVRAAGERTHIRISNARLAVAAMAAAIGWFAFSRGALSPFWLAVPAAAFFGLAVLHVRVLQQNERAERARGLYERGLQRLDGTWAAAGATGARFLQGHPYAADLDLFGSGSLFQLLNVTRTEAGEEMLAAWLRAPSSVAEVRARQSAVAELTSKTDFREDLAVLAAETRVARTGPLSEWAGATPAGISRSAALVFAIFAVVTALLLTAGFAGAIDTPWITGWLVMQTGVALVWRRRVLLVIERVDAPISDLSMLVELLARIEKERFSSERLAAMHARLLGGREAPSLRIARLRRCVSVLDATHNQLFRPIAPLFLVRSQAAAAIDRWHAENGPALSQWLGVIGELESLSSLAWHAYEHPADPFPELVDQGAIFSARDLGHPLITESTAVRNDVRLGGDGPQLLVVSGSNMSGKSTMLRAVGTNVVLAFAGAPVRAAHLMLSPLVLGASIRIEDSLQAGHSRFYSEILRIRDIVATTNGATPVLFLLDEILHGTNSHDRRIGADAIVRALIDHGAIGLITTHDLALTELVASLDGKAANVHFEDRIEDGRMVFDYRMRTGIVERSNALALMRAIGLDV